MVSLLNHPSSGLNKSTIQSSQTTRFYCMASNFSFSLAQCKEPRQGICQVNNKNVNPSLAQGKETLKAASPKGKLEFKYFSSFQVVYITKMICHVFELEENKKCILINVSKNKMYHCCNYSMCSLSHNK